MFTGLQMPVPSMLSLYYFSLLCYKELMEKEKVINIIIEQIEKNNDIACGYLFGSIVEGYYNKNSDIDIALLFRKNISFNRELEIATILEEELMRKTDLIILNRAFVNLAFRIVSKEILIYEGDYYAYTEFLEKLFAEYHDYRPTYNKFLKEFRASL